MRLRWSIDQLYFYLVCFVMLITIIVGVTSLVRAGIELLIPLPDSGMGRYEYYEPRIPGEPEETRSNLPQDVIEREQQNLEEFNRNRSRENNMNSAMLHLVRGLAQLLVAFPVYLYHWRKIPQLDL